MGARHTNPGLTGSLCGTWTSWSLRRARTWACWAGSPSWWTRSWWATGWAAPRWTSRAPARWRCAPSCRLSASVPPEPPPGITGLSSGRAMATRSPASHVADAGVTRAASEEGCRGSWVARGVGWGGCWRWEMGGRARSQESRAVSKPASA